jgi:hypothetical protein
MLVALIFTPWGLPIFAGPVTITLIGWFWPKRRAREHAIEPMAPESPDPIVPEARA